MGSASIQPQSTQARWWRTAAAIQVLLFAGACGGGGNGTADPPRATTPDPFAFVDQTDVPLSSHVESNPITVTGIDTPAPISITGGDYAIGSGDYTSESGTVAPGATVTVRVLSSAAPNTATSATLTIGGISATFSVTTLADQGLDPPPLGTQNWPMFGRDYGHSRTADASAIGETLSLHVARRRPGSGVAGTPAVVSGVVYYSDYAGWLHAVDATTGADLWSVHLESRPGSVLTPSVFVAGETVYIAGDAGPPGGAGIRSGAQVHARDRRTGAERWVAQVEPTPFSRIWSSPIVVGDTLIIGVGSYQVWRQAEPMFRGSILGLDAHTGDERWRVSVCPDDPAEACGGGVSVWSSAAVDPELGLAYIGTGQAYEQPAGPYSDALIAIDYRTGELKWHFQFTSDDVWTAQDNDPSLDRDIGAAPNLFQADVGGATRKLVGVGDKGGRYIAFDRATGEQIWERTLDPRDPPGSTIGGIMGTAASASGRIFVTNNTSTLATQAIDARPGTGVAYALDAATGTIIWSRSMPAGSFGAVTIADGRMYYMTWDGQLQVLDAGNGEFLRSLPVGTQIGAYHSGQQGFPNGSSSGPVVANGRIYVGYGWTWGASVTGGLAILESDATPPPWQWTPLCPAGFTPRDGLNTGFASDGVEREFHILPATAGTGSRPVLIALGGTADTVTGFLADSRLDRLPAQGWTVIAPVHNCTTQGHPCDATPPPSADGRAREPWFDGAAAGDERYWSDEGPDVRFIERAARCAATAYDIDQSRIYIAGFSAGGTLTHRALGFRPHFFAGGVAASGEWYSADGAASDEPVDDEIVEGSCCPRPLPQDLGHSINIVIWGGPDDVWPTTGAQVMETRRATKLAANYYASQDDVVAIACAGDHGHVWPRSLEMTSWLASTLASHPKGTPRHAFVLPPTPAGFTCVLGTFTDH
jgi:polyvinyl alcohol dehydrogenase (cytochrome)